MKLPAFLFAASVLLAQPSSPPSINFVTSDPAGACSLTVPLRFNTTNAKLWGCSGLTWTQIGGGGGGATIGAAISGGTANYNLIVDGSSNLGQEQYLGAARFPALTGDVTTTAGSLATAIGAGKVTNAMLAGSITAANLVGTDIATVGTITAGTWHGTVVSGLYGGTGTNNGSNTITLGNNLTTSGNFALTLTQTGTTNVTLPTTGTLATLAGSETLSGKTLTTPIIAQINDTNGNAYLKSTATASAVDQLTITNAATANPATVTMAATGSDSNINISLTPKGTGQLKWISDNTVASATATTSSSFVFHQFLTSSTTSRGYIGADSTGIRFLNASGSGTTLQFNDSGIFTTYGSQTVAGRGISAIYAAVASTGQTASIGATNLQCAGAVCAAGLYRVHVYTVVTTTGTGTLTTTIGWTDPGQAQTITSAGIATTAKNFEQLDYVIRADGVANITYATTLSVSGTYAIYVTLERLE